MKKLMAFLLALCMTLSLAGCGSVAPDKVLSEKLDLLKKADLDTVQKYAKDNDLLEGLEKDDKAKSEELYKLMFEKLTYEILDTKEDGDKATIKTKITNIDMKEVMVQYIAKAMSIAFEPANANLSDDELEKKMGDEFLKLLKKEDLKLKTSEVTVNMKKDDDGNWEVVDDDAFMDAITGGLVTAAESLNE